jgi:tetratricopeptide (TPR) repeat protein
LQAWYILTDLYLRTKQPDQALNAILMAETLAPNQPQIQILKVQCLSITGQSGQALISANNLFNKQPSLLAKDWSNLGLYFHQLNSLDSAHQCFKSAVELEPQNSHYRFNYATSLRNTGDLSQAEQEFNYVLNLNPKDWDAYLARSLLKNQTADKNHIKALKSLATTDKSKVSQSKVYFALAKEQEDCLEYNESFQHLKQANDLRNDFTKYNVDNDIETINCIKTTFNVNQFQRIQQKTKKTVNKQPIFIIGLPRTGTTLLERIISQPTEVLAAGELHDFSSNLTLAVTKISKTPLTSKLDFINQAKKVDFDQLGKDYLQSTKELTKHSSIFIDKMPMNFLYTGLIQQALPHAKIIHLTRSPIAACYAIYKTSFGQAYPFSYNLENLAKYYIAYRKLMSHWQQTNSNNFIEINYEQLVTSPKSTSEQVFDFLELAWREEYLQLANNKQASATASSSQVRGGIYQSSVKLWHNYQNQLAPLKNQLTLAGINPEKW